MYLSEEEKRYYNRTIVADILIGISIDRRANFAVQLDHVMVKGLTPKEVLPILDEMREKRLAKLVVKGYNWVEQTGMVWGELMVEDLNQTALRDYKTHYSNLLNGISEETPVQSINWWRITHPLFIPLKCALWAICRIRRLPKSGKIWLSVILGLLTIITADYANGARNLGAAWLIICHLFGRK